MHLCPMLAGVIAGVLQAGGRLHNFSEFAGGTRKTR